MRVANMANTFHKINASTMEKCYLQSDSRLLRHSIWRKPGFWETALKESVFTQLQESVAPQWDDMVMDSLRDVVNSKFLGLFWKITDIFCPPCNSLLSRYSQYLVRTAWNTFFCDVTARTFQR
jgi:hypothetical protein